MKVLFVCKGNMVRSQMAERFYNTMTGSHDARSAGTEAALYDHAAHRAEAAMQEIGLTLEGQRSEQVTPEMVDWADTVILFSVPEVPTFLTDSPKVEHWDIVDLGYIQESETIELDRQVRDAIKAKVSDFIKKEQEA